ncbi:hypothetical protein AB6A40_011610, partial [Gnathostoma spinigerum]
MTVERDHASLDAEITEQGNLVRQLKADPNVSQEIKEAAIAKLKQLKAEYKDLTGKDYQSTASARPKKEDKQNKSAAGKETDKAQGDVKKQSKLGMDVKKDENYSDWYAQVIVKAEMIEYYDVSGCYVLRPWSYAIWEEIQE